MSTIFLIALKELRSTTRDPYVVIFMLLPFLAVPLIMWGSVELHGFQAGSLERFPPKVAVSGDADIREVLEKQGLELVDGGPPALAAGRVDLAIEAEQVGPLLEVKIHHDSGNNRSQMSLRTARVALRKLRQLRWEQLVEERGLDPGLVVPLRLTRESSGPKNEGPRRILGLILTGWSLFCVILGTLYPALAVVVMEREHSSLETTLVLPVPTWMHIAGKWAACTFLSTTTGILGATGLIFTILQLGMSFNVPLFGLLPNPRQLLQAVLMLACAAGFASAFAMLTSAPARDFAQGEALVQTITVFTLLVLSSLGIYGLYTGSGAGASMPMASAAAAFEAAWFGQLEPALAIRVAGIHLGCTVLCLLPVIWLFRREEFITGRTTLRNLLPWKSR